MGTRLELHDKLVSVFIKVGKWVWDPFNFDEDTVDEAIRNEAPKHVYFQPPETFKMKYPCIVYDIEQDNTIRADDLIYRRKKVYNVTVIDKNPDSELPDAFADIFNARMNRHFTSDNLHHFTYNIYY